MGLSACKHLCAILNLQKPTNEWLIIQEVLRSAFRQRAEDSMAAALANAPRNEDDGISASFDGSWMRRGRMSLLGIVSSIDIWFNKIIGIEVLHKYCPTCKGKEEPCKLGEGCGINYKVYFIYLYLQIQQSCQLQGLIWGHGTRRCLQNHQENLPFYWPHDHQVSR
jgi:hypothetical protein